MKKIVLLTFVITLLSSAVIVTSATQSTIFSFRVTLSSSRITLGNVVDSAVEVANFMEINRGLPQYTMIGDQNISIGSYILLALESVIAIDEARDEIFDQIPLVSQPSNPYEPVSLSESAFGKIFSKTDYMDFFRNIVSNHSENLPLTYRSSKGEMRFVDLVYISSHILRFHNFFGFLPEIVEVKVISTTGLLPWTTPEGYGNYTSPLDNSYVLYDDKAYAGDEFYQQNLVRYYSYGSTDYEMLKLAKEIIENVTDPYEAASKVYEWVQDMWLGVVGYTWGKIEPLGKFLSAHEWLRYFQHSSAMPGYERTALLRTLGIPTKYYNDGALAYFEEYGWVFFSTHGVTEVTYAEGFLPPPGKDDLVIGGVYDVFEEDSSESVTANRVGLFVNPTDIQLHGAEHIVNFAKAGGVTRISLTVKTSEGRLYYNSTKYPERVEWDALTSLIGEAHSKGLEVYVALNVLADRYSLEYNPEWASIDWQNLTNPICVNLCSKGYENFFTSILSEIVQNFDIDGVVLTFLYDSPTSSYNAETDEAFFNDTGLHLSDVGYYGDPHGEPALTFLEWKMNYTVEYLERLSEEVKSLDADVSVAYVTYPLPGGSYNFAHTHELSPENVEEINFLEPGYHFSHEYVTNLSRNADELMFVLATNLWLNRINRENFEAYLSEFSSEVRNKLVLSYYVPDEWEFPPEFLYALLKLTKARGIDNAFFHTSVSADGDFGQAFTSYQLACIGNMKDIALRDVTLRDFNISIGENTYNITTVSNSTITDFNFNQTRKAIIFNVTGPIGTNGFCNLTFQDDLLWGIFSVYMDGSMLQEGVDYTQIYNGTHYTFYITYNHSTRTIDIRGTGVIPEFPTWAPMLFTLIVLTVAIAIYKRRLLKTPIH